MWILKPLQEFLNLVSDKKEATEPIKSLRHLWSTVDPEANILTSVRTLSG